jgi:diacylglycerol kinase family enzyme
MKTYIAKGESMSTIAVIINKKAKNSSQAACYLEALKKADIAYILYEISPQNLPNTIMQCIKKHKILLVGGGDGTIRTAAHYCVNTSIILGIIPLGTLNHFAKELDLPGSIEEITLSLRNLQVIKVDVAKVNDYIFINNSSLGFYPKFAKKRDKYTKKYNKWLSYLPGFIESFKNHPVFTLTLKSKNLDVTLRTSFVMISNNIYSYKFPTTIEREGLQKSTLGIYYFKQGKIQLFKIVQSLFSSKKIFGTLQSKHPIEIHFEHEKQVSIALDGDAMEIKTPLYFQILPRSLTLLQKSS